MPNFVNIFVSLGDFVNRAENVCPSNHGNSNLVLSCYFSCEHFIAYWASDFGG